LVSVPRIAAIVAVAAAAGLLVWLLAVRDDGEDSGEASSVVSREVRPYGPAIAGPAELQDAAGQLGHDVYCAGEGQTGDAELTLTADRRAFVRYLTGGAEPGVEEAAFLTVATYEVEDAEGVLQKVAGRQGRQSFEPPGGGLAVVNGAEPERVYLTPADTDLQVEVFHPDPGRARELVESNEIAPIG
jgi:hypothetical protein